MSCMTILSSGTAEPSVGASDPTGLATLNVPVRAQFSCQVCSMRTARSALYRYRGVSGSTSHAAALRLAAAVGALVIAPLLLRLVPHLHRRRRGSRQTGYKDACGRPVGYRLVSVTSQTDQGFIPGRFQT